MRFHDGEANWTDKCWRARANSLFAISSDAYMRGGVKLREGLRVGEGSASEELSMSDRRTILQERFKQYLPANNALATFIAIVGRLGYPARKSESFAHLAPISLTPIEPLDLPAANRNSA